jgi:hypothetical protein
MVSNALTEKVQKTENWLLGSSINSKYILYVSEPSFVNSSSSENLNRQLVSC